MVSKPAVLAVALWKKTVVNLSEKEELIVSWLVDSKIKMKKVPINSNKIVVTITTFEFKDKLLNLNFFEKYLR